MTAEWHGDRDLHGQVGELRGEMRALIRAIDQDRVANARAHEALEEKMDELAARLPPIMEQKVGLISVVGALIAAVLVALWELASSWNSVVAFLFGKH